MCYWEEKISKQIEIPYLLTVLLSMPLNKLPCIIVLTTILAHSFSFSDIQMLSDLISSGRALPLLELSCKNSSITCFLVWKSTNSVYHLSRGLTGDFGPPEADTDLFFLPPFFLRTFLTGVFVPDMSSSFLSASASDLAASVSDLPK